MGVAHVATIHWFPVKVDRKAFGFGTYELPKVELNAKPFILEVPDRVQRESGPFKDSPTGRTRSWKLFPETGQIIARDIVQSATTQGLGMTQDCHPGIWVVRESMPVYWDADQIDDGGKVIFRKGQHQVDAEGAAIWRPATREEKDEMWAQDLEHARMADAAYAEYMIGRANAMDEKKWADWIMPITKAAAKHYSITTLWNTKAGALERTQCPRCNEQIVKGAAFCRWCQGVVDPIKAELIDAQQKNAVLRNSNTKKEPAQAAA